MGAIATFFTNLKEAYYGIGTVWSYIVTTYYNITENETISTMWGAMMRGVSGYYTLFVMCFVALCVAIVFLGQKMLPFIKFSGCFIVGFALGVYWLSGIIPEAVVIPPWIIGLVVALIVSVLYRFIYIGVYGVIFAFCAYVLSYHGFYFSGGFFTKGSVVISLIVAALAVLLAFLLKKYVEMLGTAVIGSWAAVSLFAYQVYNFTLWPIFGGHTWVGICIPMALLSIAGFIVQVRTRSRY